MIGFTLYKLYKTQLKDSSASRDNAFTYVGLNVVFLNFSAFLIAQGFLGFFSIKLVFLSAIPNWILYAFFLGVIPLVACYFLFFYKKSVAYYKKKYEYHWLNKIYFGGMLFLLPVILFLSGPVLRILLFGGYMLGKDYAGYLNVYA